MAPPHDSPMIVSIGGAPSSGTTLVADLFDSVPGAACGPELNVLCIPRAFEYDRGFRESALSAAWSTDCCYAPHSRFLNARHHEAIGVDEAGARELVATSEGLPEFMRRLAERFAHHRGRRIEVFAEKTPANVNCAGLFLERFPEGRFIHVVRDGRTVVASLRRRGFTLWEAVVIWLAQASDGLAFRTHPRCITVRYEDLVEEPFRTMSLVARAVGVEALPDEIERRFRANSYRANLPRVAQWSTTGKLPTEVHRPSPLGTQLSREDLAFIESSRLERPDGTRTSIGFRDLLAEFGYQSSEPPAIPGDATLLLASADLLLEGRAAAEWNDALLWHEGYEPPQARVRRHRLVRSEAAGRWTDLGRGSARQWLALPAGAGFGAREQDGKLRDFLAVEGLLTPPRPGCPDPRMVTMRGSTLAAIDRPLEGCYSVRALGPSDDRAEAEDEAGRVTRLLTTHLYACCRKIEAGQLLGAENLLTLALACRAARKTALLPTEFERAEQALSLPTALPDGPGELPWPKENLVSSHLRRLHDAVALDRTPEHPPEYKSAVRGALVAIVLELDTEALASRLAELVREHVDPETGLVADSGSTDGGPRRPYLSPLVPLALACAAERLALPLRPRTSAFPRPKPPSGGTLSDWLEHADALLAPPTLPTALEPQCPDGHAAAVLRAIGRTATSMNVDRTGWAVAVLATPPEAAFVLSIRHDVDRPFRPEHAARLLSMHERYGKCTSVYFRPSTFDRVAAGELLAAGCEIGLHASHWDDAHRELHGMLRELSGGQVGITYHGGLGSRYWRGARSMRADIDADAAYTELLHEWFPDPRPVCLANKTIMATPLSVKVDAQPTWVERHLQLVRDFRGHAVLELHPDLPGGSWEGIIEGCLTKGALPRRVADHVNLCRAVGTARTEAQASESGVRVTVHVDPGLTVLVRTDPTVFETEDSAPAVRLRGRLSAGGRWSAYEPKAGTVTAMLRPAKAWTTRAPASPRP
jgi:hypothetical protein